MRLPSANHLSDAQPVGEPRQPRRLAAVGRDQVDLRLLVVLALRGERDPAAVGRPLRIAVLVAGGEPPRAFAAAAPRESASERATARCGSRSSPCRSSSPRRTRARRRARASACRCASIAHSASTVSGGLRRARGVARRAVRHGGRRHRRVLVGTMSGSRFYAARAAPAPRVPALHPRNRPTMTTMNYRRLGASGLKVSELSFGSWVTYGNQLGDDARPRVHGRRLRRRRQLLRQRRGLRAGAVGDDHGRGAEASSAGGARRTSSRPSSSGASTTARTRRTRSTAST